MAIRNNSTTDNLAGTGRESNYDTTQAWNSHKVAIDDEKGILDIKATAEAYLELFKQAEITFKEANRSSEIAKRTAEEVANKVLAISNTYNQLRSSRTASQSSYQAAIDDAIAKGEDQNTINKLKREAEKVSKEDNTKLFKQVTDDAKANFKDLAKGVFTSFVDGGQGFKDALAGLKQNLKDVNEVYGKGKLALAGFQAGINKAANSLSGLADSLKGLIKDIGGYKTAWDTRLFGSEKDHSSIADLIKTSIGASPYIKQQNVMEKLNSAIDQGINYNVEQRAFLDVLSDSVATTFRAFDETLNNIIRVQQADSTAYRLGMEASLTEYLNSMFESTEYLSALSDQVGTNLYQATSLLDAAGSIGYEYQVQKWLGSLYSVGMSSSAIQGISDSLGKLLSGDISATESGPGKLLVMAAANSGIDYAKVLTDGIDESEVNNLLKSMVKYLQEISNDNRVVQSQMASIFGLQTSDIQAASNLVNRLDEIANIQSDYSASSAYGKLSSMVGTLGDRISMGQLLDNINSNFKYTLAEGIAANPALYGILTIGDLLNETVGGINIPTVSVVGNSVDLNTTVADLLKSTAMGASIMTGIGSIFNGLAQTVTGFSGAFNNIMGKGYSTVSVGSPDFGVDRRSDLSQLSMSNYKANFDSDSYMAANSAMIEDTKNEASPKEINVEDMKDTNDLYDNGQAIIGYLQKIVDDKEPINVNVNNMPSGEYFNSWLEHGPYGNS